MEIIGKVMSVLPIESGVSKSSGKEWKRATIIVQYGDAQFPRTVALSNMRQATEFARLQVGSTHTFHVEPESREYNGKWFTNVTCWKWEASAPAAPTAPAATYAQAPAQPAYAYPQPNANDGYPF
jgi:hypothetical protein